MLYVEPCSCLARGGVWCTWCERSSGCSAVHVLGVSCSGRHSTSFTDQEVGAINVLWQVLNGRPLDGGLARRFACRRVCASTCRATRRGVCFCRRAQPSRKWGSRCAVCSPCAPRAPPPPRVCLSVASSGTLAWSRQPTPRGSSCARRWRSTICCIASDGSHGVDAALPAASLLPGICERQRRPHRSHTQIDGGRRAAMSTSSSTPRHCQRRRCLPSWLLHDAML